MRKRLSWATVLALIPLAGCASAQVGSKPEGLHALLTRTEGRVRNLPTLQKRKLLRTHAALSMPSTVSGESSAVAFSGGAARTTGLAVARRARPGSPRVLGWSNGKKGDLRLLNVTMLIKSGAMSRPDTIATHKPRLSVGRQVPEPYRNMIKNHREIRLVGRLQASVGRGDPVGIVSPGARLHRSSARHRARRFGNSNGKPGKLELLNMTMIINSGAMARDDSIRVNKPRIEVGRRAPTFRPDLPRPRLHRSRPPRTFNHRYLRRQLVGGRCFGTSCDD